MTRKLYKGETLALGATIYFVSPKKWSTFLDFTNILADSFSITTYKRKELLIPKELM